MNYLDRLAELNDVTLTPIPDYGDLIPLKEFNFYRITGSFIHYDGSGFYATNNGYDEKSDVWSQPAPVWASHVLWFGR